MGKETNTRSRYRKSATYRYNRQVLVCSFVGVHLLLRNYCSYGIIFVNVCVISTAMAMLLRDYALYGIIYLCVFITRYVHYFRFSVILGGQFTSF